MATTSTTWEELKVRDGSLSNSTLEILQKDLKFDKMTPVQMATIPLFLNHKDVLVQAATGSGKTLAFLIPIFETLLSLNPPLKSFEVGALIITPTRELALQIFEIASVFSKRSPQIKSLLLVGGSNHSADLDLMTKMGGANLIIATPGRLEAALRHLSEKISFKNFEMLVLDEADRLLNLGFEVSIRNILTSLPKQRRTGLFSATQTKNVEELARAGLRNPARIEVNVKSSDPGKKSMVPRTLSNYYQIVPIERKIPQLFNFLQNNANDCKVIVFVLTRSSVDYITAILDLLLPKGDDTRTVFGLHGAMVQSKRKRIYAQFKETSNSVLVCTDLAARGIDVEDVKWILQYDPPQDPDFFVHRVGRTARAGRDGQALVYLTPEEEDYIPFLEVKKVPIESFSEAICITDEFVSSILQKIRDEAAKDRDLMEKGSNAFVSFVRGYKEHHCDFVFLFNKLKFGDLARGMALLFLPRMPDLKRFNIEFENSDLDKDAISFKDKQREKQRLANLEGTLEKREKRIKERKSNYNKEMKRKKETQRIRSKRKRSKLKDNEAEWDELAIETTLMKKLKKGKISKQEFEEAIGERSKQ